MPKKILFWLAVIFILTGILVFTNATFITIEPGERGVVFKKFTVGLNKDQIYKPGFHIIAPWNEMYIYNVKQQQREQTLDVLDKNGLSIIMDVTIRFNPMYDKIGYLHEQFGKDYIDELIIPELRSSVRSVIGRYSAEEVYATKRKDVEENIIHETKEALEKNNVHMNALLIRSIKLPTTIKQAIEKKLKEEQEALAYKYRLKREELEAKRKKIAAEAEARANNIINSSLTGNLLKMRGIEATIKLSESNNAKTVIIGNNKDGLPIILGNQ